MESSVQVHVHGPMFRTAAISVTQVADSCRLSEDIRGPGEDSTSTSDALERVQHGLIPRYTQTFVDSDIDNAFVHSYQDPATTLYTVT